ncbi:pyridoxal phosphate-dependent aminotransferase [Lacicoccus alkaliphilus]|uniref:Aspartate/methionine/tyrosine aminotransferase n=1 Tax=Lacicoccus alkaliphilus DSM 16010 TaxID=1123231 RepID=A0A1M7IKU4_9BACL|nr:pyridoxal phosphate-dependent aminotransferase [Salinicoccus alkaliphilus]SHM41340.1 Aspartate/methionine/tyrosine aminotransferase [Salinicoccus alkaliphilus DSM 16010]
MSPINDIFDELNADLAPGQEKRLNFDEIELKGGHLPGETVDFSHGDVDAFEPIPEALDNFNHGYKEIGAAQAYTVYRGREDIRLDVAEKLSSFSGTAIDYENELIITPGTQGALFLAAGAMITPGDKVAIIEPDYYANRKLVHFFRGELYPVTLDYMGHGDKAGIDLKQLEDGFKDGVSTFIFSNPNNPSGVVYSKGEITEIGRLIKKYDVNVIVDELYSRQVFDGRIFTHLSSLNIVPRENIITIIGPSKTESLSGFRLGVAYGAKAIIDRMEQLQAIVSLRAGGYSQIVLKNWFNEPDHWMIERIEAHREIRNELLRLFREADFEVRTTEAGSYIFPRLPGLSIDCENFAKILNKQAKVIVTPGTQFGPGFKDSIRLNFSQDKEKAVDAVKRLIKVAGFYKVE